MNQELKNEFLRLAKEVFGYLKSLDYKMYYDREYRITVDQYSKVYDEVDVPNYMITFLMNCDEYIRATDLCKLNQLFLTEYPFVKDVIKTSSESQSFDITKVLEIVLVTTFGINPTLDDFENVLIEELEKLEKIFTGKKTRTVEIYPIKNVDIYEGFETFFLEDDIYLKKLSDKEINYFDYDERTSFLTGSDSRLALAIEYDQEIVFSSNENPAIPKNVEKIRVQNHLIFSLNLLYSGSIAFNESCRYYLDYYSNFGVRASSANYIPLNPFKRVTLNHGAFEDWTKKYRLLSKNNLSPYQLALTRLSEAERRINILDVIIDGVIALESILLNDVGNEKTRGELRFRFSVNYATLFPKDERKKQRKTASDIYELRSSIVHGGTKITNKVSMGEEEMSIEEASKRVIDILRYVLNYLLMLPPGKGIDSNGFWINRLLNID